MSTSKRIGTSVVALSAFTLMIASVGTASAAPAVQHELAQQNTVTTGIDSISSPMALDSILSPDQLLGGEKGVALQSDIHHHNWLGGDNDVQTSPSSASLASIAGNNTSRFDV